MNNERRKHINRLISELQGLGSQIEDIKGRIDALRDEEQEYYDNMPESFQSGEKGGVAQAAIDALENAHDDLPEIDDVISYLETAAE